MRTGAVSENEHVHVAPARVAFGNKSSAPQGFIVRMWREYEYGPVVQKSIEVNDRQLPHGLEQGASANRRHKETSKPTGNVWHLFVFPVRSDKTPIMDGIPELKEPKGIKRWQCKIELSGVIVQLALC